MLNKNRVSIPRSNATGCKFSAGPTLTFDIYGRESVMKSTPKSSSSTLCATNTVKRSNSRFNPAVLPCRNLQAKRKQTAQKPTGSNVLPRRGRVVRRERTYETKPKMYSPGAGGLFVESEHRNKAENVFPRRGRVVLSLLNEPGTRRQRSYGVPGSGVPMATVKNLKEATATSGTGRLPILRAQSFLAFTQSRQTGFYVSAKIFLVALQPSSAALC